MRTDRVPVAAASALDPDTRMFSQRVPARLFLLPQAELAGCDLELASCRPDIEDFVVGGGQMLVEASGFEAVSRRGAKCTPDRVEIGSVGQRGETLERCRGSSAPPSTRFFICGA